MLLAHLELLPTVTNKPVSALLMDITGTRSLPFGIDIDAHRLEALRGAEVPLWRWRIFPCPILSSIMRAVSLKFGGNGAIRVMHVISGLLLERLIKRLVTGMLLNIRQRLMMLGLNRLLRSSPGLVV